MTREQALPYVSIMLDTALSVRKLGDIPLFTQIPDIAVLVGWECGYEPMFVAVFDCYEPGKCKIDVEDAIDIATDYLLEVKWFNAVAREPDFVIA